MHSEPPVLVPGSSTDRQPLPDLRAALIQGIEAYALKAGLKPSTVSTYAAGSGRFYQRLVDGKNFGNTVAERVLAWLADKDAEQRGADIPYAPPGRVLP